MDQASSAFTRGGISGSFGIMLSQPFDVIRIQLQTTRRESSSGLTVGGHHKPGITSVMKNILQTEGIKGCYKGIASPMVTSGLRSAVTFLGYDLSLKCMGTTSSAAGLREITLAGFCSALSACPIVTAGELVKVRVQLMRLGKTGGLGQLEWLTIKEILRQRGISGFACGVQLTATRDAIYRSVYFPSYEFLARSMYDKAGYRPAWVTMTAGALAGFIPWVFAYPVDVLKTHWQSEKRFGASTISDMIRKGLVLEGPHWLYRGFGATLLRAAANNAAVLSAYEALRTHI